MGFFLIIRAELVRGFIIMRRYWFRTMTGLLISYGTLMVIVFGFMSSREEFVDGALSGRFGDPTKITNFILGFIIGMFAFGVVGMFTQGLQSMMQTGVLEQLCMSPHGLITNFMARATVSSISMVLSCGVLVWMVTYSVGGTLHWSTGPVLVLLALTFINLLGFGFMVGGLVLVFKQVGQIAFLIRMGLFAVAIFASQELLDGSVAFAALLHALPITDAAICLKYVLIDDQMMTEAAGAAPVFSSAFTHSSFYFLLLSCVTWTIAGTACFKVLENWSRSKGTLGAY